MTLFASYNDSDDDPIIELSRANINRLGLDVDGSSATWNTLNNAPNENWADDWAAVRENTFAYAKFNYDISDALSVEVAPYIQKNDGIGEFSPPGLQPRIVTNASGVREQVMFGNSGSRSRTATYQNAAGNAVFNYTGGVADTYRALDGSTVSSADCYNVDGTLKLTNAAPTCAQGQSYRNSLYYHTRSGVVINGQYEVGNHKIRAGVWFETMDRDFGRAWLRYDDIRKGPIIVAGSTYRQDFEQNFKTDLIKLHIADDWTVNDRLTVSLGLQHFIIDISGTTKDESRYAANGTYNGPTSASVSSDSEDILPSIGAVYDVTDHLQVFGGYSRNFGAIGDWALEKTGTDFKNLEPEIAQNLEAGVRYTSSRIAAAATLFKTENDNAIIFLDETFASSTGGINYNVGTGGTYVNAPGGIETTGIEASARVKLTKELGAYLSLTSLNSEYSAAFNAANYGASRRTVVAAGNKVPGTPDILVGAALDYTKGPFKGAVTARYVGESEGDAQNRPELVVPSYTLVDVSGSYRMETANNGYVEAQIAINNITNERYIGGILDEFNQRYTPGAPRSVHFTLSVGF
jgi:iron complex outermembrane receptor protein